MAGGQYPNMPFNQQLSFPVTLTLRTFPEGVRLCTWPVKEIDRLHDKHHHWAGTLKPGQNPLADVQGELFDVRLADRARFGGGNRLERPRRPDPI